MATQPQRDVVRPCEQSSNCVSRYVRACLVNWAAVVPDWGKKNLPSPVFTSNQSSSDLEEQHLHRVVKMGKIVKFSAHFLAQ